MLFCMCPWLLEHTAQKLALGFDWGVKKPCYRRKTSLVVGGTRTQVLADSMTIAASTLTIAPPRSRHDVNK